LIVLISHSFALTGRVEPLRSLSGETLGELGVTLFLISGFLIAKSWLDDPALIRFIVKRALRCLDC
jgi:peptidoglycan/LPS O-acetylase OafA/YrhL